MTHGIVTYAATAITFGSVALTLATIVSVAVCHLAPHRSSPPPSRD